MDNVNVYLSDEAIKKLNDEIKNARVMPILEQTSFIKADGGKPNLAILLDMPQALAEVARVLEYGAAKYDRKNWAKCDDPERYMAAALRHLTAYHNCEILDPESGRSHLAHAICSLLFLEEMRSER